MRECSFSRWEKVFPMPAGGPYCTYTPTSQRMRVNADPDVPAQKPGREFTGYKLSLFFPPAM